MNEAETRAELIDPALAAAGWGVIEGSRVLREHILTPGRLEGGKGRRARGDIADYVLVYRGLKLAVIEAKAAGLPVTEGLGQAKAYAGKLGLRFAYATNGKGIHAVNLATGSEGPLEAYPTPEALWAAVYPEPNVWRDRFAAVPVPDKSGSWSLRCYQEVAVNRALEALGAGRRRLLVTLATGTGKTSTAFQFVWKLFKARWTLAGDGARQPRILFLADRNTLANQAFNDFNAFNAFEETALVRISPDAIRKTGKVPANGAVFFTIFQTFMASAGSATEREDTETEEPITALAEINPPERESAGYMYILQCGDGSFYTGSTKHLNKRLAEHQSGEGAKHTGARLPVKLVHFETFDRIDAAFAREKQIQGWSRAKKLALIQGDSSHLKKLALNRSEPAPVKIGSAPEPVEGYFGEYPKDFFDLIIIDECHRGGANDEGEWRAILEYFSPAAQLGLTATPKRKDNADTYAYFGEPLHIYSLKEGINDGFLTPFRLRQMSTTLDEYIHTSDNLVEEGAVPVGRRFEEREFNRDIVIPEREEYRVKLFLDLIDPDEKTLVFCAGRDHALLVRDLINKHKSRTHPDYCVRVTSADGDIGEQFLKRFQDNEQIIPTILTTSHKLSTGVDARNVRNIVLMRPVPNIIEFKQIVGRGTRLYDGKDYFTIIDFVKAHLQFSDPEWDGEPEPPEEPGTMKPGGSIGRGAGGAGGGTIVAPPVPVVRAKVRLADGKERTLQHMTVLTFWHPDGSPISAKEFLELLYGKLPALVADEADLRTRWSDPASRMTLLDGLGEQGFGHDQLAEMGRVIDAESGDIFDVLAHVAFGAAPISRKERAAKAEAGLAAKYPVKLAGFLKFVLAQYVKSGVEELDPAKLPALLNLRYNHAIADSRELGSPQQIREAFAGFQRALYD